MTKTFSLSNLGKIQTGARTEKYKTTFLDGTKEIEFSDEELKKFLDENNKDRFQELGKFLMERDAKIRCEFRVEKDMKDVEVEVDDKAPAKEKTTEEETQEKTTEEEKSAQKDNKKVQKKIIKKTIVKGTKITFVGTPKTLIAEMESNFSSYGFKIIEARDIEWVVTIDSTGEKIKYENEVSLIKAFPYVALPSIKFEEAFEVKGPYTKKGWAARGLLVVVVVLAIGWFVR